MDYKSLLSLAEKKVKDSNNEFVVKKRPKEGQTSGPNKASIEAFKARKMKEEIERERERQREKDRLIALRSQNSKSMKKAKMMKTRTKDNDFSRIVLTEEQLEEQQRVEEKLKRKGTQDLAQNKKSRNELEDKLIRNGGKRLNNNKNNRNNNNSQNILSKCDKTKDNPNKSNNENKAKPRPPKPALSYEQLLSLATEKAKSEKKSLTEELMSEVEEKKQIRPMTQKEKDRLREEMYYKQRAQKGMAKLPDPEQIKKNNSNSRDFKKDLNSKPKPISDPNGKNRNNQMIAKPVIASNPIQKDIKMSDKIVKNNNTYNSTPTKKPIDRPPNDRPNERPNERPRNPLPVRQDSRKLVQSSGSVANKSQILNKMNNRLNSRDKEYNQKYLNASKERQKITANSDNRHPNRSINERARPPSPPPIRREMPKLPPIGNTYRRGMYEDVSEYMADDYEEEEDDDMSDFIDDGPEEKPIEEDYSRAIREIFGYDKRKYRNIEDDDDIEEANFAQCMKEDARSARIGLLEDLEEERKEEEEKKRKSVMKKRLKN